MKTSALMIATLAAAAATAPVRAGGISSVSFSYEQTVIRSQPCANGGENQQSVTFGISLGGGCARPVYQPAAVVYPHHPVVYVPRPVAVMPAPVCVVRQPVMVVPYGAGAMAAHNIGMAHAVAARNVGRARTAGGWARFHR